jgi:hypothetical protein
MNHNQVDCLKVILIYGGRMLLPKGSKILSVERLVTIMKITAAGFFRTASTLDYDTHLFTPMGENASDINLTHRFTVLEDESTCAKVAQKEVNQKYNLKDKTIALWNIHIVGHKDMETGIIAPENDESFIFPKFYIFWSFHHCISDGLSGWAFIRKFMSKMGPESFQLETPSLDKALITTCPPPLIDNLINTNWIELLPGIFI